MKRTDRYFLILTVILLIASCAGGSKTEKKDKAVTIEEHFQLAYSAAQRGDLREAVKEYQKVLDLDSKNAKAHLNLGIVYGRQEQWKKEISQYEKAIRVDPDFAEAYFNLGVAYQGRGRLKEAMAQYQKTVQIYPNYIEAHTNLGIIHFRQGRFDQALAEYQKTIEIKPEYAKGYYNIGSAYRQQKKMEEAAASFEKALETYEQALNNNPENPALLTRMALLYAGPLKQLPKALDLAKQARKLAGQDPQILHVLGRLAFLSGDYIWASSLLHESAQAVPDDPEVTLDLAWSHFSLGRLAEALEALRPALRVSVPFPRADEAKLLGDMIALYIELLEGRGDPDRAISSTQQALATSPDYVPAILVLAGAEERRSNFSGAAPRYERVLAIYSQFIPAMRSLARLYYYHLNDKNKAYEMAIKARQAFPEDPEVAKILGILSYERKDFARAAQLLREASLVFDKDEQIQQALRIAREKLKQR